MANKKPLVNVSGDRSELPSGDQIAGSDIDPQFVADAEVTGDLSLTGSTSTISDAKLLFKNGNDEKQWEVGTTEEAQVGTNAGAEFNLKRYDDVGALLGTVFTAKRSNGRFGIGATSPQEVLEVSKSSNCGIRITTPDDTTPYLDFFTNAVRRMRLLAFSTYCQLATMTAIPLRLGTNNIERMTILANGDVTFDTDVLVVDSVNDRVGMGTDSPKQIAHVHNSAASSTAQIQMTNGTTTDAAAKGVEIGLEASGSALFWHRENSYLRFGTNNAERMRIDSAGKVGIGIAAPDGTLHVHTATAGTITANGAADDLVIENSSAGGLSILTPNTATAYLMFGDADDNNVGAISYGHASDVMIFDVNASERMRIDSAGKVGIGETVPLGHLHVKTADSSATSVNANANELVIEGSANSGITILGGTAGTNYLMFGNSGGNAEGWLRYNASTKKMDIQVDNSVMMTMTDSDLMVGKTAINGDTAGVEARGTGFLAATVDGATVAQFHRLTNDGILVNFAQGTAIEGSISVSGTTVSYNGAHLSRWSQLPAERKEILRGSVLSNLDEMCEWGAEDNEQLNKMEVSKVVGDKNVAGVFQAWDDDDDTYENDFYCAMTGDFIIRIAEGSKVSRGDLLMSAGDGTAKAQDDDLIRSSTIAKVTSTKKSIIYKDGSYCVPCVLMAC